MTWVWDRSRSRKTQRLVLLAIADCASDDGANAYPSMAELIRKTGFSERAVQSAIGELIAMGELRVDRNGGPKGCNRYTVVMTPAGDAPPQDVRGARPAGGRKDEPPQARAEDPAGAAPPAAPAGVQELRQTPADPAPGTVLEPSTKNSSSKSSSKGVRGTRIPGDFAVTDAMREYAVQFAKETLGREPSERFPAWLDRKTLDFVDYWSERPGAGGLKLDWVRAWQRWMRREIERSAEQPHPHQSRRAPGNAVALRDEPRPSTADLRAADGVALYHRLKAEEAADGTR